MAKTLTKKEYDDLFKQIQGAQTQVKNLTTQVNKTYPKPLPTAPTGQVLGASANVPAGPLPGGRLEEMFGPDAAKQEAGAQMLNEKLKNTPDINAMKPRQSYETDEDYKIRLLNEKFYLAGDTNNPSTRPTTLSNDQATGYIKSYGLTGLLNEKEIAGLTPQQAAEKAKQKREEREKQTSTLTSSVFNPETINKTRRAIDNFGLTLNEITNSPFNGDQTKLNKSKALIESTSKQLSQLFKTPEEFQNAYNTNQTFKDAIDRFQKAGGKVDSITSAITTPVTPENTSQPQTTADYLSSINNPLANQEAQQKAIDDLIPERDIQQAEISRLANIPKELMKHYWGDESQIGLLQQQQKEAEEAIKITEREEKNNQANVKAQAKFAIEKNQAETRLQTAQIEENRLAAKNYMTGYLAKLGALNTTGAAGLAIQTLDTKYELSKSELETNTRYDNQAISLKLNETLNTIETETDREILKIQQDLSKTTEDVFKEVTKAQQEADKETARITLSYAKTLNERTAKYTAEMKKNAEDYAKKYAKIVGNGLDLVKLSQSIESGEYIEGQYVPKKGVLLPNGTFAKLTLTPTLEREVQSANLSGIDTIKYFVTLPPKYRNLLIQEAQSGGTQFSTLQAVQNSYNKIKKEEQSKKTTKDTTSNEEEDIKIF